MKAVESYTFMNLLRVIILVLVSIMLSFYVDAGVLVTIPWVFTLIGLLWLFWEELNLFPISRYPRSSYFPTLFDTLVLGYFTVISGGLNSFIIGGFFFTIVVGSTNKWVNQGLFALVTAAILVALIGVSSHLEWLPGINIFGPFYKQSLHSMAFAYSIWLAVAIVLHLAARDITKRELVLSETLERERTKLDEQAQELRAYLNQSPLSIVVTDRAGTILDVNRKTEEQTGYTREELIGGNPRVQKSGKTPEAVYTNLWATISSGKVWQGEFINRDKWGREYWEQASISPILDAASQPIKYLAIKEDVTEKKRIEFLLRDSEAKYRMIAENTHDIIWKLDLATFRFTYVSPAVRTVRGWSVEEALSETLEESVAVESYPRLLRIIDEHRRGDQDGAGRRFVEQYRQTRRGGGFVDLELSATFILNEAGDSVELLGISRDITQRLKNQEQTETIQLLLGDFREDSGDSLLETDRKGIITSCPESLTRALGESARHLRSAGLIEAIADTCPDPGDEDRARLDRLSAALSTPQPFREHLVRLGTGRELKYLSLNGRPVIEADGSLQGWQIVSRDVTGMILHTEELERIAWVDQTTGLQNRAALQASLARFFAERLPGSTGVLTLVHLQNIKPLKSIFGHVIGDEVLTVIARRIKFLSGEYGGSAARTGDADFAFFVAQPSQTYLTDMESSLQILNEPVLVSGHTIDVAIRTGAALTGDGAETVDDLFFGAEHALNHAVDSQLKSTKLFDASLAAQARRKTDILGLLPDAIDAREFEMLYQPQIAVATGLVGGAESLVRWNSPKIGRVSPVEFIPVAEQNGLIISLGAWIQKRACEDAVLWPQHWKVAVNVAAAQLTNRNFARSVVGIMEQSGLAPERLKIEITESSLIAENRQVREQLEQLRSERIRVALDDFGTGFSSLSYLKDLPIDELKIDQSFVRAMDSGARSVAIVETILRLARDLGLSTTAEGVETTAQAAILRELGCDYYQGYLYAKPLSREELLAFEPT